MESSKTSFVATNCCAFCHEQFPLHCVPGPDAWQSMVRAVVYLNIEGEASIELTKPTCLPSNLCDVNVALTGRPRTKIVTISRKLEVDRTCESDRLAFCFHSWCYAVLTWELKGCSVPVIYRLARALAPDPSIWEDIQERRHNSDSASRLKMLACYGEQPLFLSRLPTELRTYIWRYTGLMTPYSAFLLVKGETSRLAGHLRSPPSRGIMLQRGSYLSANMVSVFGTEYIQDLIMGGDSKENCRPNSDTTGVKYIISLGGLCAIQFLSIDWESDWIGKIPSVDCTWYGIIRGAVSTLWYGYSFPPSLQGESCGPGVVWKLQFQQQDRTDL
ncbi:hypothetical protein DL95DRAFT_529136 [Leptodontidium sp. 2 PMI_412]|nr:hypothetical protein DL95DRAFT_529136 [Leptodontidium sp. 2 PMI_412]